MAESNSNHGLISPDDGRFAAAAGAKLHVGVGGAHRTGETLGKDDLQRPDGDYGTLARA
jgi:hypothetical protein